MKGRWAYNWEGGGGGGGGGGGALTIIKRKFKVSEWPQGKSSLGHVLLTKLVWSSRGS